MLRRGATSELGWVVVEPAHRGRGLGELVCRGALGYVGALGHRYAYLLTEDFRRAAIKTYLRLGFEPEILDASHPARWAALRCELGPMALPTADDEQSARWRGERVAK
jgi:mycothiol synthase